MNEIKRLRRCECVYRCPMKSSNGLNMGGDCTVTSAKSQLNLCNQLAQTKLQTQ